MTPFFHSRPHHRHRHHAANNKYRNAELWGNQEQHARPERCRSRAVARRKTWAAGDDSTTVGNIAVRGTIGSLQTLPVGGSRDPLHNFTDPHGRHEGQRHTEPPSVLKDYKHKNGTPEIRNRQGTN